MTTALGTTGTSNFETFAYSGYGTGDTLVALSTSGVATAASVGYQAVTASINDYGLTGLGECGMRMVIFGPQAGGAILHSGQCKHATRPHLHYHGITMQLPLASAPT